MKMKPTPKIIRPRDLKTVYRILVIAAVSVFVFVGTAFGVEEKVPLKMELPPPEVPQPQLFCGY
jgi:hypothetical protein